MATHATVWTGLLSSSSTSVSVGMAVVRNGDDFYPATSANRTSYGRAVGVAITAADSTSRSFEYQVAGSLSADDSGVGSGTANDWVIVSATGTLTRTASPGASDDIIGRCPHTGGDVQLMPVTAAASSFTAGGDLSGTSTSQTVEKIKGTTITTAGGALPVGAVLRTTAVGTADWGTVNLADTDAVTGTLPVANGGTGITALGAGVATWLGTPSGANLASALTTALSLSKVGAPTGTGFATVTSGAWDSAAASVGAGVLTFLATPSSANLAAAVTDETGTGALVFANTPTLVTPVIGAATGTSLALGAFGFVSIGTSIVAQTGAIRLKNELGRGAIKSRKADDSADVELLWLDSGNQVQAGDSTHVTAYYTRASTSLQGVVGGTNVYSITATQFSVNAGVSLRLSDSTGGQFYTFSPSNLAADRTITLPLLTGDDTLVTAAFAQTLTNKTIDLGSNTLTFTSAQIKTACSDETGTGGSLVFATAPTLTTPKIADSSGGQTYDFAVSDLAANRTVTLPLLTGNDTFVFQSHSQTLTNKTYHDPVSTGIAYYTGTRLRTLDIPGEVQTTTATSAVVASHTIVDNTTTTFDFVCTMRATGATAKAGRWSGTVTYYRNGGAPVIVGAAEYGTAFETTAGDDVTFLISTNTLQVIVTSADADDRNWTCALRVQETLNTA